MYKGSPWTVMERKFKFEEGEYYHIYNRGIEKRRIFLDQSDYGRFQNLLYLANGTKAVVFKRVQGLPLDNDRGPQHVDLLFYALMPNHFHIIAKENKMGGISKFLSKISTSYSMYFNTKYERSGALLCHPFRAQHLDTDDYFRWAITYIHLNPLDIHAPNWRENGVAVIQMARNFLRDYKYSSYADYFAPARRETKIIHKENLPISMIELDDVEKMFACYTELSKDYPWTN